MVKDEKPIRVLVAGCGRMGKAHARAYQNLPGFQIVGLVSRGDGSREALAQELGNNVPLFNDFGTGLEQTRPDAVSINTYPDTHAEYAIAAMNTGAHVFMEKPLAETLPDAETVVKMAWKTGRKLVVGYILQHHPSIARFLEIGKTLGKPLVMRMNLNQQSAGADWEIHKRLMESCSPLVDCGVHYVDLMCRVTDAQPVRIHAIGARLSEEIRPDMINYGHLHVVFDDGSVGWFEAGWGPMMSEGAPLIKDIIGPRGSVTLVQAAKKKDGSTRDGHDPTRTSMLRLHHSELNEQGFFKYSDEEIKIPEEPSHQDLCDREQAFFMRAIREDLNLGAHHESAMNSLRIALAADQSRSTGSVVSL